MQLVGHWSLCGAVNVRKSLGVRAVRSGARATLQQLPVHEAAPPMAMRGALVEPMCRSDTGALELVPQIGQTQHQFATGLTAGGCGRLQVMDRLEEHLRLIAQALRSGDSDAARDADRRWEAQGPPNGPLTYTPGLARQLAELGRLSDEQGSEAAVRFVAALGRLTAPAYASPQMRLRMARDATVAK